MKSSRCILLVEDDGTDVDVALRALRRAEVDAAVEIARDGQEALEMLGLEDATESGNARPAVVFLDISMPRVDGWEVLRRIRHEPGTANLPVVILSTSDRPVDVARSYELGANSFLHKRFDSRSPGAYIAEAARYWLDLNCPPPKRSTA